MQVHGMQRSYSGRIKSYLRRSHENCHPEKDETHCQKETGKFVLQPHLICCISVALLTSIKNAGYKFSIFFHRKRSFSGVGCGCIRNGVLSGEAENLNIN